MKQKKISLILVISTLLPMLCFTQERLLEPKAFDRMIVQDITYAIVGEATPTSGIKVDISKPEGSISGVFPTKSKVLDLIGFELKGGVTEQNFVLFKGYNTFNTAYEGKASFYYFPWWSSAKYGTNQEAKNKQNIGRAKNKTVDDYKAKLSDTVNAIGILMKHYHKNLASYTIDLEINTTPSQTTTQKSILISLIKTINDVASLDVNSGNTTSEILAKLGEASVDNSTNEITGTYNPKVEMLYNKYKKIYEQLDDDVLDKKIANAKDLWTSKLYMWFTLSPFAKTEKVNEFYTTYQGIDSLYFKSGYRFYGGVSAEFNMYWLYSKINLAQYVRLRITTSRTNNLKSLNSFTYETNASFFSYPNITTNKVKSGTAYNHSEIKVGRSTQLAAEYYLLPLKTAIPGLYLSPFYNISNLYNLPGIKGRESDNTQFGVEGGIIFNIGNREKEKSRNIFSLIAYLRHEDLTDSRRTKILSGNTESKEDYRNRNLSIGIKIGIPINLPKKPDP